MAANAGGGFCAQLVAGGDPGRLRSPGRTRAASMPVRRWTERAPPIATAVVKATVCAGSRTGRSARAVSCFSARKLPGGGTWGGTSAASPPTGYCADCYHGASSASVEPQVRHASIGAARRQRLVGVTGVTGVSEGHRQLVTALTVIMAFHHRSIGPQAKQACSGRGHPVQRLGRHRP